MASSHAPKNRSRTSSPSTMNKLPHASFFRIILPYILQQNKLKLPLKFVRRYGSEISSIAKLSLPNGHAWKVGVEKKRKGEGNKGEEMWLSDGWGEFMDHHSISKGFFLVFKYRGYSAFDVEMFDLTTSSISYSPPPPPPPPPPRESGFPNIVVISDDEKDDKIGGGEIEKTLERLKASGIVTGRQHSFNRKLREMYKKCKKGVEDAILASNPAFPSFIILLSSDHVGSKARPVIPLSFARDHIPDRGETSTVVLQMGQHGKSVRQWSVQMTRPETSALFRSVTLGLGWRQFKDDNNLGVGDVCLFHLVSPEDLVFDVSIFPAAK